MSKRAVIHSKTLQAIISREDMITLAWNGDLAVPVTDSTKREFGEVTIIADDQARRAMLEHLDQHAPREFQRDWSFIRDRPTKGAK